MNYTAKRTSTEITIDVCMMQVAPGLYRLTSVIDGADYRDESTGRGIWSIGKDKRCGTILAATDDRFVGNPYFECLWLR